MFLCTIQVLKFQAENPCGVPLVTVHFQWRFGSSLPSHSVQSFQKWGWISYIKDVLGSFLLKLQSRVGLGFCLLLSEPYRGCENSAGQANVLQVSTFFCPTYSLLSCQLIKSRRKVFYPAILVVFSGKVSWGYLVCFITIKVLHTLNISSVYLFFLIPIGNALVYTHAISGSIQKPSNCIPCFQFLPCLFSPFPIPPTKLCQ